MAKDPSRHPSTKTRKANRAETAFDPVAAALHQLHESVASEAVPEDFLRLLSEIDAKIAAATPGHQK